MYRNNGIYSFLDVYELTLRKLREHKSIAERYDLVESYQDAVWQIANFMNGHLRFTASLQEEYPELLVLAWHYAHKEFGCPLKESEYEAFVEALRVDVYKLLMSWVDNCVGMAEYYKKKNKRIKK
jgi:hypothetical protein